MHRWSCGCACALAIVTLIGRSAAAQSSASPARDPDSEPPSTAEPTEPDESEGGAPAADDAIFFDPAITGEAIVVWGERPDKPFDRDTELRLTGEELARQGVTNLADALELLPDIAV